MRVYALMLIFFLLPPFFFDFHYFSLEAFE